MGTKIPLKNFSFGGCSVGSIGPAVSSLSPTTPILNVTVSFEEALKLSLAIQECVRKLNGYNRATTRGKRTALNIAVHLQKSRLTINEASL
jgi:hypothetical protein